MGENTPRLSLVGERPSVCTEARISARIGAQARARSLPPDTVVRLHYLWKRGVPLRADDFGVASEVDFRLYGID